MDQLTAFDVTVLGVVLLSMLFAFSRGFVTVALSLAAWAGAFFVATTGAALIKPYGRDLISPPELADILTLVGLFFITLFVLKTLAEWIGRTVKTSPVGFLDRSLGALFGMARGIVIVSVAFLAFTKIYDRDSEPDWVAAATLRPIVAWSAEMVEDTAARLVGVEGRERGERLIEQTRNAVPNQFFEEALEDMAADYSAEQKEKLDDIFDQVTDTPEDPETRPDGGEGETR